MSHDASRSRWKCTQPFGTPVVPDVKAMIATSSAAVSTGSKRAARRAGPRARARRSGADLAGQLARDERVRHLRLRRPPSRSRRARSSGIVATTIPPASRIPSHAAIASGVFGRVQQHARPRLDLQRGRDRLRALAQLGVAPAAGDRRPLVREQLDRRVHPLRPVEQQQVGPLVAWRQLVARERVHQSRPASTIFCASSVGFVNITSWLPGIWTSRHRPSRAENRGCQPHFARRQRDVLGAVEIAARDLRRVEAVEVELVGEAAVRLRRERARRPSARAPRRRR